MIVKSKTSVLIVDHEGKENKVILVPTKILLIWKKYFLLFNGVVTILLILIGVFIYQKTSSHYQEKLVRANKIRSMIDIDKTQEAFQSIDQSIIKINTLLQEKGLKKLQLKAPEMKTEPFEVTDIKEISEAYNEKILDLEHILKSLPLGAPVPGVITSEFGGRENPFGIAKAETHKGLDFRGNIGDPVKATAGGVVEFSGVRGGYGNCVIIRHHQNLRTLFGHMSKLHVQVGQNVKSNQVIGEIGSTGRSTGPHLHYEIIQNDEKVNPRTFLKI